MSHEPSESTAGDCNAVPAFGMLSLNLNATQLTVLKNHAEQKLQAVSELRAVPWGSLSVVWL